MFFDLVCLLLLCVCSVVSNVLLVCSLILYVLIDMVVMVGW